MAGCIARIFFIFLLLYMEVFVLITMQVKKNKLVYEELFPFRKCGDMVQPDSELCKECGGICCNAGIRLYPRDFERGKEVVSLIKLLKMELVVLCIEEGEADEVWHNAHYYDDFIEVRITGNDSGSCIFKCVWGCILPANMRPVICKFCGPVMKQIAKRDWKQCTAIQCHRTYGDMDWRPFKEELLKMGILDYPNVTINGDTK